MTMGKREREIVEAFNFGLIALVRRLGGTVTLSRTEVDETDQYVIEPIFNPLNPLEVTLKVRRRKDVQRG